MLNAFTYHVLLYAMPRGTITCVAIFCSHYLQAKVATVSHNQGVTHAQFRQKKTASFECKRRKLSRLEIALQFTTQSHFSVVSQKRSNTTSDSMHTPQAASPGKYYFTSKMELLLYFLGSKPPPLPHFGGEKKKKTSRNVEISGQFV